MPGAYRKLVYEMSAPDRETDLVVRAWQRRDKLPFVGRQWRFGKLRLTDTYGTVTDFGRAYLEIFPEASLSHFDRKSKEQRGAQLTHLDPNGRRVVTATLRNGKVAPTLLGSSFFARNSLFKARIPVRLRSAAGEFTSTALDLTDLFLLQADGGEELYARLQEALSASQPDGYTAIVHQFLRESLRVRRRALEFV